MKKIEVKTKCGETFTLEVDTNQEIESMQEVIESLFDAPECKEDVQKMVEFLHGGKWKFSTNTENTTYEQLKGWVNTTPENMVIIPWAFYGSYRNGKGQCFSRESGPYKDDMRLESHNSVWVRCLR